MSGERVRELMLEIAKLEKRGYSAQEVFTAAAAVTLGAALKLGMSRAQLGDKLSLLWALRIGGEEGER